MTSTLTLYYNSKILPNKLFSVDSVADYLATLTKVAKSNFQYIKHGLSITININNAQDLIEYESSNNINYCSILNEDSSKTCYYFVTAKQWVSETCVRLVLLMDTLNTFKPTTDYTFSNKTKVIREHKNRFVQKSVTRNIFIDDNFIQATIPNPSGTPTEYYGLKEVTVSSHALPVITNLVLIDPLNDFPNATISVINIYQEENDEFIIVFRISNPYIYGTTNILEFSFDMEYTTYDWYRAIDLYSEGLTPVLYKTHSNYLRQADCDYDFYLVYANQNDPSDTLLNPVDCFLIPGVELTFKSSGATNFLNVSEFEEGYIYFIGSSDWNGSVKINGTTYPTYYNDFVNGSKILIIMRHGIYLSYGYSESSNLNFSLDYEILGTTSAGIEVISGSDPLKAWKHPYPADTYADIDNPPGVLVNMYKNTAGTVCNAIEDLDRTSAKLIKIIKLPYTPIQLTKISGTLYEFDADIFEASTFGSINAIKLKDLNTRFDYGLDVNLISPFKPIWDISFTGSALSDLRNINYESKLYHSDYYQPKFIYDSFGFIFNLERVNLDDFLTELNDYTNFEIDWVVTTTINSKFMFGFPQYKTDELSNQDYDSILPIARNNELTIYNQQYINYIRTGFNYDVKTKERSQAMSWIGVGLTAVGTITSFALAPATGGMSLVAGIGLATATASQVISSANSTAQSEQNLQAKQTQLQNQATSVSGSDDVDLMSKYTLNRAKMVTYEVSTKMKLALFDVFHYTGYVSGVLKTPDMTSRKRFNFVSCVPIFDSVNAISEELLEDLRSRFEIGVTFLHKVGCSWDFDQKYENYETILGIS